MDPPKRVQLPSGRTLALRAREGLERQARRGAAPLFSELVDLVTSGGVVLREGGAIVDVQTLELRDFHALRAIAIHVGWLEEEPVEIPCRNCGIEIRHAPCAALALGPFVDAELDDPELDRTLDFSVAHPIPAVGLDGGRVAREVVLKQVTVRTAAPLHRALRRRRLRISEEIVASMGIASLGPEHDPRRMAHALERCSEEAWAAIGELFLAAHYPPRLATLALCPKCGARNDVGAPYEREFEPMPPVPSNAQLFAEFDAFDEHAHAVFRRLAADQAPHLALVVDGGVPACDDGGEPLLGSYDPPGGDPSAPLGVGEITVYYRSFRAMWDEDGTYDWQAELEETIEHELDHHAAWRTGHDSLDDEEREEIVRERALLVGRKETVRSGMAAFGADIGGFLARTWPIWLIVALWAIAISMCGEGGPNPN